jgi:hypothetical protein
MVPKMFDWWLLFIKTLTFYFIWKNSLKLLALR